MTDPCTALARTVPSPDARATAATTGTSLFATALSVTTQQALRHAGLNPADVLALVRAALAEDLAQAGDLTSLAIVPADERLDVAFIARAPGVVCGLPVLAAIVEHVVGPVVGPVVGADHPLTLLVHDGDRVGAGRPLATLTAPARQVLALERIALNLLGHLCGIATSTRAWVDALAGTGVIVRDTRKTTPLLRSLEKYAVRCGGGTNHRTGLFDQILIKDNHLAVAGSVGAALQRVAAAHPHGDVPVQLEVDSLAQLEEALAHGAEQILLDNFTLAQLREAVVRVRDRAPDTHLEASGGLQLDNARAVALTGIDSIAVGALTHSAPALDIGLDTTLPSTGEPV